MYLSETQNLDFTSGLARVLIVDDQLPLLRSLQSLLQLNGCRIDSALSGGEAILKLQDGDFDLVLLDLQMPGIDGFEVLDYIRQAEMDPAVLVVSSDASFASVKEALRLGAFDFIRKPYNPGELLAAVEYGFRLARIKRESAGDHSDISPETYRRILDHSPDFVYLLDAEGHFIYVNNKIESLLGYQPSELIQKHFSTIVHPRSSTEVLSCFRERRQGDRAARQVEVRLLGKLKEPEGKVEDLQPLVELSAVGLYESDGRGNLVFVGTLGAARDIGHNDEGAETDFPPRDEITRLPSRVLFNDRLSQSIIHACRHRKSFSLLFLDLDRFKLISDSFGKAVGDELLQQASARIHAGLRAEDTLCRYRGYEFALLLPGTESLTGAATVAEKILRSVRQPFKLDHHQILLGVSVGLALYPDHGKTVAELMRNATLAMDRAKQKGQDGYCDCHEKISPTKVSKGLARELKDALKADRLELYFQPWWTCQEREIAGIEVLICWRDPAQGLRLPEDFMPVADASGLIVPLGLWALKTLSRTLSRWYSQGVRIPRVGLPLSPQQLERKEFSDRLINMVRHFSLAGESFQIELSERGLRHSLDLLQPKLHLLRNYGVGITIKDFGCSSFWLEILERVPLDTLKIDRTFIDQGVSGQAPAAMIDEIAMLAGGLRLKMAAEGVKDESQLASARQLGCREVQGPLFGDPLSATAIPALLNAEAGMTGNRPLPAQYFAC